MYDRAFRGGTVVTDREASRLDVYVHDGRIAALGDPDMPMPARAEVDARGLHLLPGIVDAHTHFRTWSAHSDSLADLVEAAAFGGVTTVVAFVMGMNATELSMLERIQECRRDGDGRVATDFAFHAAIADEAGTLEQVAEAMALGVTTFKMFMINRHRKMMVDDGFLHAAMGRIASGGGLAMVHAELEDIVASLGRSVAAGTNPVDAFAAARPAWVEAEATRRAVALARRTSCPLYVVHVTCEAALEEILAARAEGQEVYAETCPQYLHLDHDDAHRLGGPAKVAPPLRTESDRRALTAAVLSGDIDVVASDHAPHRLATKSDPDTEFAAVPVGMPGTETLLPMTWKAIVDAGGDVTDMVRVLAAAPARIIGLTGKGQLAVGNDADLTLVDLDATTTVDASRLHGTAGYSPFDGWESPLRLRSTFLRGAELLGDDGSDGRADEPLVGPPPSLRSRQSGQFIPRPARTRSAPRAVGRR